MSLANCCTSTSPHHRSYYAHLGGDMGTRYSCRSPGGQLHEGPTPIPLYHSVVTLQTEEISHSRKVHTFRLDPASFSSPSSCPPLQLAVGHSACGPESNLPETLWGFGSGRRLSCLWNIQEKWGRQGEEREQTVNGNVSILPVQTIKGSISG